MSVYKYETQVADNLVVADALSFGQSLQGVDRDAFDHHRQSTEITFQMNPVRYFKSTADIHYSFPPMSKSVAEHGAESVTERLEYLRDKAVQSALLGYWMHEAEDTEGAQVIHEVTDPLFKPADQLDWKIKEKADPNRSKLKFYVAKVALGALEGASDMQTILVERHTYAATALDGKTPRPSDIKHILNVEARHPYDQRPVIVSRTSTSFYAFKRPTDQDSV